MSNISKKFTNFSCIILTDKLDKTFLTSVIITDKSDKLLFKSVIFTDKSDKTFIKLSLHLAGG